MKILSLGEIIWDIFPDKSAIGGAPLNFAAHAKKAGADSYLLSAVGDDDLGEKAVEILNGYGVNTSYVSVNRGKSTGRCIVTLDDNGVPAYDVIKNVAWDDIIMPGKIIGEHFDAFAFGTLSLREGKNKEVVAEVLSSCMLDEIFVDLNLRAPFYSKDTIEFCLERATILKVSDEELPMVLRYVFGEETDREHGVRALSKKYDGIKMIILTCGAEGSALYDSETDSFKYKEAIKTKVASTVGAGDSYGAAFLCGYLEGRSIDECLERATRISSFVVSVDEAIPEY